jgi:hypothetical protein
MRFDFAACGLCAQRERQHRHHSLEREHDNTAVRDARERQQHNR